MLVGYSARPAREQTPSVSSTLIFTAVYHSLTLLSTVEMFFLEFVYKLLEHFVFF